MGAAMCGFLKLFVFVYSDKLSPAHRCDNLTIWGSSTGISGIQLGRQLAGSRGVECSLSVSGGLVIFWNGAGLGWLLY
ncbi:hypothetical protein HOY80DRAFT_942032 [Tuber brumale]|nr:hypothetical protein HOY80DRAFT_942032 [Tuber brumale]